MTEYRRKWLRRGYYFDCQCERCTDEEELLERSGRSTCCPDGAVLPRENKRLFCFGQPLVCNKCGKKSSITLEQINDANKELAVFYHKNVREKLIVEVQAKLYNEGGMASAKSDADACLSIFNRMERVLSPYNLRLYTFIELAKTIHRLVYNDDTVTERLLLAERKTIEKYSPFGLTKVLNVYDELTSMQQILKAMDCSPGRKYRCALDGLEKSRVVITNIYGPDHPLVTGLKTPYKYCEGAYADYLEQMERNEESEENGGGGEEAADGDGYFTSKPISWK